MSVIPKIPRASGGKAPLGTLPGFYPGPAGDLKRSPDPSPTHAPPPLTTNPGSAPGRGGYYNTKVCTEISYSREIVIVMTGTKCEYNTV